MRHRGIPTGALAVGVLMVTFFVSGYYTDYAIFAVGFFVSMLLVMVSLWRPVL